MRATAADHLRRGLTNSLANWQLLLLTVAERVALVIILFASIAIAAIPLIIAGVLTSFRQIDTSAPDVFLRSFVFAHPFLIVYAVVALSLVFIPPMLVYAFFEAGKAEILLRGERAAGASERTESFRAFDLNAWSAAAAKHWWSLFLIVNIVWAVALALVLLPLVAAVAVMVVSAGSSSGVTIGCAFAVLALLAGIALSLVANVWMQLALLERVESGCSAGEACRRSWRLIRANAAPAATTTLLLLFTTVGGMISLIALQFSIGMLGTIPGIAFVLIPVQIVVAVAQSAVTALLASWTTGTFASLKLSLR